MEQLVQKTLPQSTIVFPEDVIAPERNEVAKTNWCDLIDSMARFLVFVCLK